VVEIPRFRCGQQPKLREMILLNDVSGRLVLSDSGECAGKIISVNPRSRGWRGSRFTSR
jgi:hypothetical protein